MGCDIHGRMEIRHGGFRDVQVWWSAEYPIPTDRDYDFFGILAGVRNYCDMPPISEPKGLPADVSEEVKKESQEWGRDGHSHSYLTLKELDDYSWDFESTDERVSVVKKSTGEELYKASYTFEQDKSPEALAAEDKELKFLKRRARDLINPHWKAFIELMRSYAKDPEDVRIVFWFDN